VSRHRALLFVTILLASVGCDHATKELARNVLELSPVVSVAGDAVRFELVRNSGAFLGLGSPLPEWVRELAFLVIVPLILAFVCVVFWRVGLESRSQLAGLGLVAGGGIANWLDRLFHGGAVTDFVSLGLGPLRTGIFNVADVAIVAGVGFLIATLSERDPPESEPV